LRDNLKSRGLIWAALVMGFLVTLIETVCTGQVYVPALQLIKLGGGEMLSALLKLFLYNVAFIIPLLGVFGLTFYGVKSETLAGISKKYLPVTKIILGVLFICLAILLWYGHRPPVGM
jgi:thiol:disulfide interchange protein